MLNTNLVDLHELADDCEDVRHESLERLEVVRTEPRNHFRQSSARKTQVTS